MVARYRQRDAAIDRGRGCRTHIGIDVVEMEAWRAVLGRRVPGTRKFTLGLDMPLTVKQKLTTLARYKERVDSDIRNNCDKLEGSSPSGSRDVRVHVCRLGLLLLHN